MFDVCSSNLNIERLHNTVALTATAAPKCCGFESLTGNCLCDLHMSPSHLKHC